MRIVRAMCDANVPDRRVFSQRGQRFLAETVERLAEELPVIELLDPESTEERNIEDPASEKRFEAALEGLKDADEAFAVALRKEWGTLKVLVKKGCNGSCP